MAVKTLKEALAESANWPACAVKTATYTVAAGDTTLVCNTTSNITLTLPAATGSNKHYQFKNINTGTVTIEGDGAETIDGSANYSLSQWDAVTVFDYAAGVWIVLSYKT